MRLLFFLFSFTSIFAQKSINVNVTIPPTEQNPSIQLFLQNLQREEGKYSYNEQLNLLVMTTRLRKIFYSSPNYDKYLIKGVAHISAPYCENKEINVPLSEKTIKTPIGFGIKILDKITYTTDTLGNVSPLRANLYSSQEVGINPQETADIGHTLCGLDAAFHLHAVAPPTFLGIQWTRIKIDKNTDGNTWVGDLGSALAEVYFAERLKKRQLDIAEQQAIIDVLASPADMLGNIDAYVMDSLFLEKKEQKVTEVFEKYYLSDEKKYKALRQNRYQIFAKEIGLVWNGKNFENHDKMLKYYADQVNDAAAFYYAIAAKRGGRWNLIKALPSILKMSRSAYAKVLVRAFFDTLQKQILL